MKQGDMDLGDANHLLQRVRYSRRPLIFLFGSAVSNDPKETHGVPKCQEFVELVRIALGPDSSALASLLSEKQSPVEQYQTSMRHLLHARGIDAVNFVIREAVAHARRAIPRDIKDLTIERCQILEKDLPMWVIGRALDSYAAIKSSGLSTFDNCVLTTNFDPLIALALRRHDVLAMQVPHISDGSITGLSDSPLTHVIHLHGHWYLSDTQHTVTQLAHERPRLKAFLRRLLERRTLVVLGYGGWQDVITETLFEIAADDGAGAEILWGFYPTDPSKIETEHSNLLQGFKEGAARGRILYYAGVDVHDFFHRLERGYDPPREEEFTQQISAPVAPFKQTMLPSTAKDQYINNPGYILDITGLAWLVVRACAQPSLIGKIFKLERRQVFVGRSVDCDVSLAGNDVSRRHALLERRMHRWDISNKSSTNGLFVEGAPVADSFTLRQGAKIVLGHSELMFTRSSAHASDEANSVLAQWVDRLDGVWNARFLRESVLFYRKNNPNVTISFVYIEFSALATLNEGIGQVAADVLLSSSLLALNEEIHINVSRLAGPTFVAVLDLDRVASTPASAITEFLQRRFAPHSIAIHVSIHTFETNAEIALIGGHCIFDGSKIV